MSPARQHFLRTTASRQAALVEPERGLETRSAAERMQAQMRLHQAALKTMQSRVAKTAAKAEFLREYSAYVDGVLEGGRGAQDDVLAMVMLWRLDTGDFDGALLIAAYAVQHGLSMPGTFARSLPTTVLEQIADVALDCPDPDPTHAGPLEQALLLTGDADMPDEVRAKAHKALGFLLTERNPAKAIDHFEAALALDPKCGVRTKLSRLRKSFPTHQEGT